MKKIIIACAIFMSPAVALGADLPGKSPPIIYSPTSAEPAANWSGLYVGANAGAGFGDVKSTGMSGLSALTNASLSPAPNAIHRSGPVGGLQAGYSVQSGSIVYGLEGDFAFGSIRGSLDSGGVVDTVPFIARLNSKISALMTVRGRVGYAFDDMLLYGTGGFASGYHEGKASATSMGATALYGQVTEWVPGWTLGAGGEYAMSRNVSLKVEYLYAQLNNKILGQSVSHSLNLLRAGANYRF